MKNFLDSWGGTTRGLIISAILLTICLICGGIALGMGMIAVGIFDVVVGSIGIVILMIKLLYYKKKSGEYNE